MTFKNCHLFLKRQWRATGEKSWVSVDILLGNLATLPSYLIEGWSELSQLWTQCLLIKRQLCQKPRIWGHDFISIELGDSARKKACDIPHVQKIRSQSPVFYCTGSQKANSSQVSMRCKAPEKRKVLWNSVYVINSALIKK